MHIYIPFLLDLPPTCINYKFLCVIFSLMSYSDTGTGAARGRIFSSFTHTYSQSISAIGYSTPQLIEV